MTTMKAVRIATAVDPTTVMSQLAGLERFGDYLVYERLGEWVFAADPLGHIALDTEEVVIDTAAQVTRERWTGRPIDVLDKALQSLRAGCGPGASGTVYGWVGFEFSAYRHGAEQSLAKGTALAYLIVPRLEVTVSETGASVRGATTAELEVIEQLLELPTDALPVPHPVDVRKDSTDYRARVGEAIAEIAAGRYQKVILSRRVELPFGIDLPATYRLGRSNNNPARSFLMQLGSLAAAGFSPELVVAVDDDGVVTTEPLAGTRACGRGATADLAARNDLESNPKEIVEHAISVRASWDEIASISEPGSVSVSDFMAVRERGSVQHLASSVRGQLAYRRTSWEALEALFPSITASGIPKREGIEAILRNDAPRGLYSGAVVTFAENGSMEAALVLRAVYQSNGNAWLRAGAGIIAQSQPEREFEETCEKLNSVALYLVRRQ